MNQPKVADDELPVPTDTEIQVWESYYRLRSRRRVATELKISERQVRNVLDSDGRRLRALIEDYREMIVADKEEIERAGMNLLFRLMTRYDAMLCEIERAASEALESGHATGVTKITNADGVPLTVPQAVEFIVCSRGFTQLVDMISKMRKDIDQHRDHQTGTDHVPTKEGEDVSDDFGAMDPAQLAEILEQGGAQLPGVLGRLRKHVVNTAS